MTTITRENAEIKSFITGFLSDPAHDNQSTDSLLANVFRIALASLEAEPVAYIFKHPAGKLFWALTDESNKDQSDVIPVYAAPPVPVVPEEKPMPNPLKMYAVDAVAAIAEVRGWNACRAAMLQGANVSHTHEGKNHPEDKLGMVNHLGDANEKVNSPVTPDGWISCSERMPEETKMLLAFSQGEIVAAYWNWVVNPIDYKKYRAFTYLSGNILDDVTHWMPLPEPPQEVK
ncbi:DUF551 domain-containing protein [Escherichia coli]|uniref:DUF551 domain-containing protein n=1 Tax=Escherichia coli TaxID=562 RepID=UPI000F8784F7|nr:DUF551 domain-containing protein [Escherichia coli]MDL6301433.1 DUF551 domain-containing protein [Escherichia coli]MDL6643544.1 DUF551 domain-containing protein [Escherichia coli]MDL6735862.1 DUF551 domain-containing protein [Escherichia coli]RUK72513.1 DUF551 domain-containing protein [Escherichia coli]HAG8144371.1 DUF551 domain-containing protein [Escherichia coli]